MGVRMIWKGIQLGTGLVLGFAIAYLLIVGFFFVGLNGVNFIQNLLGG